MRLHFLTPGVLLLTLATLTQPAAAQDVLFELHDPDPEPESGFGFALADVPDVDGDGVTDLLVGAPDADPGTVVLRNSGRAYVFSGATGALLHELIPPAIIRDQRFGHSVSGVPDVDGDGRGDLLVGVGWGEPPDHAYVYSGATGALLHTLTSPFGGGIPRDFGEDLVGLPDVDGDGQGDLLIGESDISRAHLFSGATGALLRTLVSPNLESFGDFGRSVSGVADADGDGVADLLVGAYTESPGASPDLVGRAYVFSGDTGALLHELASPNEEAGSNFGNDVAGVPDADGDGRGDLLVGAWGEDVGGLDEVGRVYLFSGASGDLLHTLDSPYVQEKALFGWAVEGVPDVDGDGRGDLAVTGQVGFVKAVFSGATGALLFERLESGGTVGGVPDVDGDARGDLLVSSGRDRVYLFSGAPRFALTARIVPVDPPVVLPLGGGAFTYTVTLTNVSFDPQSFDAWVVATLPDGSTYGPVEGPRTLTLPPGGTLTRTLTARVPGGAPSGTYTLTLNAGAYPAPVVASDSFTFEKEGASGVGTGAAAVVSEGPFFEASSASTGSATIVTVHPNPARHAATLSYVLAEAAEVRLAVYDVLGREVAVLADGPMEAGPRTITLDASALPAGVYVYRLVGVGQATTGRLTLVK